jgi:hypothetical protein
LARFLLCFGAVPMIRQKSTKTVHLSKEESMEALKQGADTLFILLGAVMVLAMHAGFAFLELGTVRKKNQVNALVKILVDFSVSTVMYFLVGYAVAYGASFFVGAEQLAAKNGYELVKFFFLLTFAAAIPAIISGGIAERAKFWPQLLATAVIVGFVYPFFEGIAWNQHFGVQAWIKSVTGEEFHDFAGSIVVHAVGGWIALAGCDPAGRSQQSLPQGRCRFRASAVQHSFPGLGRLGSDGGLVRLQRHERPDAGQDIRPGGGELAHGDGRGHLGRIDSRQERPGFRP